MSGCPSPIETSRSGYRTIGFDVNAGVVNGLNAKRSHIQDISSEQVAAYVSKGQFSATMDMSRLSECDAISICVPTPLGKTKDPDMSYIMVAAESLRLALRPGQLIVLESTTFPGTTREVLRPVLEQSGLKVGDDFFLCFSPERVDPGNTVWQTRNTPKVLGGLTPACLEAGLSVYSRVFDVIVPVESAEAAELVKLYENTLG